MTDIIPAEVRRQAVRLESRAVEMDDAEDAKVATLLWLLLAIMESDAKAKRTTVH